MADAASDLPCGRHIFAEHDHGTLGWTGQHAYIRLPDPRHHFTAACAWLDATDVKRVSGNLDNAGSRRTMTDRGEILVHDRRASVAPQARRGGAIP